MVFCSDTVSMYEPVNSHRGFWLDQLIRVFLGHFGFNSDTSLFGRFLASHIFCFILSPRLVDGQLLCPGLIFTFLTPYKNKQENTHDN